MQKLKKLFNFPIFVLLISLPTIWALLVPGFFGASDELHIAWLYQMHKTLMIGQIPPRFVPDLSYGFGYPLFNFVYPMPFYIGEIFYLVGLSLVDSIKAVFLISMPLSALAMYALVRQFASKIVSLTAATLYIYAPYRANDLYNRGAIGEIVSFIFLPLITLCVVKLAANDKLNFKWIGIGALSIAGLILTHNITAYMVIPLVVLLGLLRIIFVVKEKAQAVLVNLIAAFLGLSLSSYFWLPAILDSSLMKYDTVFNFVDHFPTLRQLVTPFWGYGASVAGPYDGMSFFLGWGSLIILIISLITLALKFKKINLNQKIIIIWVYFCFVVAVFLMNFRSTYVWENMPMLVFFQFPWRFLILTTFVIPILAIILEFIPYKKYFSIVIILITVFTSWYYFEPNDFLGRTDGYFLNRYIPIPAASNEYKLIQEEYLRLPNNTQIRPDKVYPTVFPENEKILVEKENDLNVLIKTNLEQDINLSFNKYYFPGWNGYINGHPLELKAGNPFGQINFDVPKGKHEIRIIFEETPSKILINLFSVIALLVTIAFIFNNWFARFKKI